MKKQSAKKHYDMLKGAGYDDDMAKSMCAAGIEKGMLFDDLASEEDKKDLDADDKGTKKGTASEALEGFLAKGLSQEAAEMAVHDLIKSGAVEDDGVTAPDVSDLDRIAEWLAKGGIDVDASADLGVDDPFDWLDDDDGPTEEDIALIKGLEMIPEIGAAISVLAGSQSKLVKSSHASITGLAKSLSDSIEKLNGQIADLSERLEKGLGAKMPPRTPTGAQPQPSPQDDAEGSDGGDADGDALSKSSLRADLLKEWAEAQRSEPNSLVKGAYGDAINELRAYEDPHFVKERLEGRVASLKRR